MLQTYPPSQEERDLFIKALEAEYGLPKELATTLSKNDNFVTYRFFDMDWRPNE